jgi:hypothetical protein
MLLRDLPSCSPPIKAHIISGPTYVQPFILHLFLVFRFIKVVDKWVKQGLVRVWSSPAEPHVGTLDKTSGYKPLTCESPLYVACGGMRALAEALAAEVSWGLGGVMLGGV